MRAFVIQIPPAMIASPTRMISTSIVSHRGICFEGFSVMLVPLRRILQRRARVAVSEFT